MDKIRIVKCPICDEKHIVRQDKIDAAQAKYPDLNTEERMACKECDDYLVRAWAGLKVDA